MPQENPRPSPSPASPKHRGTAATVYSPTDDLDHPVVIAEKAADRDIQLRKLDTVAASPEPTETAGLAVSSMFKKVKKTADTQTSNCCTDTCTIT